MMGMWRLRKMRDEVLGRARLWRARQCLSAFPTIRRKQPHGLPAELIVSLTSYPPRFPTLSLTLRSLLDQTTAADRTILWVSPRDRLELPADVVGLVDYGLEIRDCDDWLSYKKLVPALLKFPDAFVVTADDDLYFESDWLAGLVRVGREWPGCIIAKRAHLASRDNCGSFAPYSQWEIETKATADHSELELLFPTNGAGALFPPGTLHPQVTNARLFTTLCPFADDVWFFWMARLLGTPHRRIPSNATLLWWNGSQDIGLFHENMWGGRNDDQIAAMERHFGKLPVKGRNAAKNPKRSLA